MLKTELSLSGLGPVMQDVARLRTLISGGEPSLVVGVAAETAVKKRFAQHAKKQNRLGGQSTHYWTRAADSVQSSSSGGTVTILVTQRGVALHLHGGTVRPKNVSEVTGKPIKFLTIPKVAQAHGKTVAMLAALGVNLYPGRGGLLRQTGTERDPEGDEMWFALARSVTIKADATVIPSEAALAEAAREALLDLLATVSLTGSS